MKTAAQIQARHLRLVEGKEIAKIVGVSQSSVSAWVRDIVIEEPQRARLLGHTREARKARMTPGGDARR
jgi:predicted transcriptional regulator